MAHLKFEGDIEDISARQLEFISEFLESRGFNNEKNFKIENVGKAGDNYIANVKRITVENDGETFKMIAKVAPTHELFRAKMNTQIMFHNEHVMYTDILPKFSELEKAANLLKNERLKYAVCYGSLKEAPYEVILLEDLKESSYVMLDRFISLTNDAIKLVLKEFAKLHSLSYAMKNKEPETYTRLSNKLINIYSSTYDVPEVEMWMETIENDMLTILTDEKYKRAVKGIISKLYYFANKNMAIDAKSKFSVIQQGDSWTNNIMFKLEGNKTTDCCMIDYQVSRVNSPVSDIQYLIFNCTDYETRSKNYNDWIEYYHDQLEKCLSNFGLKANFIYPKDQLDIELRRHGKLSFSLSALLATVLMRESSEVADMKALMEKSFDGDFDLEEAVEKSKISATSQETILKFKKKMEGLIDSFLEYGYL